jgi:alanine racemase
VSRALADAGARSFFVAATEEAEKVRKALGPGPRIFVYSGHMPGDASAIKALDLIPLLNSIEQITDHIEQLPGHPFGVQLDSGMNRLGLEPMEWAACRGLVEPLKPQLVISHLACGDTPEHPMNAQQLASFTQMIQGVSAPVSLAATAGVLLGPDYHFDLTRPGIGLHGGRPFEASLPVVYLSIPVIQTRTLAVGESVGYGNAWTAERPSRIATIAAGYADGLIRAGSNRLKVYADKTPCPIVGRVSMDLITVDVTDLETVPAELDILCAHQGIDDVADACGTIGYEILTNLGGRYARYFETEA